MSVLSENIKFHRKQNNLTQKKLAKILGVAPTAVSAWELGRNKPLMDNIEQMSETFNIKKSVLLGDTLSEFSPTPSLDAKNDTVQAINDTVVQLHPERQEVVLEVATAQLDEQEKGSPEVRETPAEYDSDKIIVLPQSEEFESLIVHGLESAGEGIWQENDVDIEVRIPASQIPDEFDDLAMVIGDSMRPKLHNGDILFITFTKQIEIGQIGVFRTSKGNFVKKLQPDRLESLNPNYDDIYFNEDEFAEAIGVVEDIYRK